jgi:hypothetical protein
MSDPKSDEQEKRPPVIDHHLPPAEPKRDGPLGSLEGADRAALGLDPAPQPASPAAQVDPSETALPGPKFGDQPATAAKPWYTSLAAESDEAEIGAEPDPEGEI